MEKGPEAVGFRAFVMRLAGRAVELSGTQGCGESLSTAQWLPEALCLRQQQTPRWMRRMMLRIYARCFGTHKRT